MSLALRYVSGAVPGDEFDVMVPGRPDKVTILSKPPLDPQGKILLCQRPLIKP